MTNPFYSAGEDRADRVGHLFGAIATRYDLLNDIQSLGFHRIWKQRLVQLAKLRTGTTALDVCCGTGDIAFRLAQEGAEVIGLDFSPAMLEVARRRQRSTHRNKTLEFIEGNVLQLPFPDERFTAVTVGYGLRNLSDWRMGLKEMVRVARPGGRVLVLEFGKPRNSLLRTVYFLYLRAMVPLFGLLFCGNASAYAYILESLRHFPTQDGVAAAMHELGLEPVQIHDLLGGMMSMLVGVKVVAKH